MTDLTHPQLCVEGDHRWTTLTTKAGRIQWCPKCDRKTTNLAQINAQHFGNIVRYQRMKNGYTRAELARRSDCAENTVKRVEQNGNCTLASLSAMLDVFDLEIGITSKGK